MLDLFLNKTTTKDIISNTDETYKTMVIKLCENRLFLEKKLTNSSDTENIEKLQQLKESMKGFGISEIDYQVMVTKLDNKLL